MTALGCAAEGPYRRNAASTEMVVPDGQLCEELRERSPHTIPIAYVEIDEQGALQEREQIEQALTLVTRPGKPKYVVVFVHGWFHNASQGDDNVRRFKCALNNLQSIDGNAGEEVVGIYVGWRGESWTIPVINYLTFWDRKNTSEEIGRGSLVEFLIRLEQAAKPPDSPNKLMLVGHSFGASVVFNSIGQIMLGRFLLDAEKLLAERQVATPSPGPLAAQTKATHPQSKPGLISAYGDLVVLVNPAIEATRIVPFFASLNEYGKRHLDLLFDGQPPRLVILSSQGDWATRRTFPVARVFSTLLESYQNRPLPAPYGKEIEARQRYLDWQTMGNAEAIQTHVPLSQTVESRDWKCPPLDPNWLRVAIEERKVEQRRKGEPDTGAGWSRTFEGTGILLRHLGVTTPSNPLWIMAVSTSLIPDHSGIANPLLLCFFDSLLGDPKTVNPQAERYQQEKQR